jgi:phosphoglycolate phosphatase
MVTGVLFDLDMTLVETRRDIATSANEVRRQYGLEPLPLAEVASCIGDGVERLLARILGDAISGREADALGRFRAHYALHCLDATQPYDGIPELLGKLQPLLLGVVSNKPTRFCELVLEGLGLSHHFGVVVGGDDRAKLKPSPAMLLEASATLGIASKTTVMVGDTWRDMRSGRGAAMHTIGVTWGLDSRELLVEEGADALVDTPAEIATRIASWS